MNPSHKISANGSQVIKKPLVHSPTNTMSDPISTDISAFQFAFGSTAIPSRDPPDSPQSTARWTTSAPSNPSSYPSVLPLAINNENVGFGGSYVYPSKFQAYDTFHDSNCTMSSGIPLPDAQRRSTMVGEKSTRKTPQTTAEARPITRPIPISRPLSGMVPAASPGTASPSVAPSSYPTTTPRAIHKKPRSYDLRDDFAHHAAAAHTALAEFHSRRVELRVSEGGDASDTGTSTKTHWSTASAPQLSSNETAIRMDSRNARSWPMLMKGGQLLH